MQRGNEVKALSFDLRERPTVGRGEKKSRPRWKLGGDQNKRIGLSPTEF